MLTEEQEEIGRIMYEIINTGAKTIKECGEVFGRAARKLEEEREVQNREAIKPRNLFFGMRKWEEYQLEKFISIKRKLNE